MHLFLFTFYGNTKINTVVLHLLQPAPLAFAFTWKKSFFTVIKLKG